MIIVNSSLLTFYVQLDGDHIHGGVEILQYLKSRCTMRYVPTTPTFQKIAVTLTGTDPGGNVLTQGPIYYYTDIFMCSDKIDGFFASPLGFKYFMFASVK